MFHISFLIKADNKSRRHRTTQLSSPTFFKGGNRLCFFYYFLFYVRYNSFFSVSSRLSKLGSFIAFLSKSFLEKVTKFNPTKRKWLKREKSTTEIPLLKRRAQDTKFLFSSLYMYFFLFSLQVPLYSEELFGLPATVVSIWKRLGF